MNDRPQDTEDYRAALLRHHEEARVSFVLDRKGRVSQVIIVQSSGSKALDQWAIRIIRNGHYAPFPYDVWPGQEGYTFEVPLRFQSTR